MNTITFISIIISLISILLSVAFYTTLERKMLSYIQIRKGPNKVGLSGLLQPFSDAIKLFNKTTIMNNFSNIMLSTTSPFMVFLLSLMIWPFLPLSKQGIIDNSFSTLTFLLISSLNVYALLIIGWSANSKYSHTGAIRNIAQMISYEITFFLIFLTMLIMVHSYCMSNYHKPQINLYLMIGMSTIAFMWMISCLAEVNRSPFDFAEGESELVSGFNVEYMGSLFALIFLAEYTNMIIISTITTLMFFGPPLTLIPTIMMLMITILLLWVRGTFPRFRYDLLMSMSWTTFLPAILLIIPIIELFSIMFF